MQAERLFSGPASSARSRRKWIAFAGPIEQVGQAEAAARPDGLVECSSAVAEGPINGTEQWRTTYEGIDLPTGRSAVDLPPCRPPELSEGDYAIEYMVRERR